MHSFTKLLISVLLILSFSGLALAQTFEIEADDIAAQGATLRDFLALVNGGFAADTALLVTSGGHYGLANDSIYYPIVIKGADGLAAKPEIRPHADYTYANEWIRHSNDLTLENLIINGMTAGTSTIDSIRRVFKTDRTEIAEDPNALNYEPDFILKNVDVMNIWQYGDPVLDEEGKLIEFDTGSSAGVVLAENCTFTDMGDEVFNAGNTNKAAHIVTPAHGGAFSSFTVKNCTFDNIDGSCIKLNGDTNAETMEDFVLIENVTFYFCQRRVIWARDLANMTVRNILIANSKKGHETFSGTDLLMQVEREGSSIAYIDTFMIEGIKSDGDTVVIADQAFLVQGGSYSGAPGVPLLDEKTIYGLNPMFADPENGDFTLAAGSPVRTMGHDGGPLGDSRWAKSTAPTNTYEIEADDVAAPGATLRDFLALVNGGFAADTALLVTSGGHYGLANDSIYYPIVIKGADGLAVKPEIRPHADYTYANEWIRHSNDLTLENLIINGMTAGTSTIDSIRRVFKTDRTEIAEDPNALNYEPDFILKNVDVMNIWQYGNPILDEEGKLIEFDTGSSAGVVLAQNCTFTDMGDEVFNAGNTNKAAHIVTPVHGGAFSSFTVRNCTFNNIDGSCIKLNGDADSTTFENFVLVENVTFYFCQRRVIWARDLANMTVRNILIANSKKGHETFSGTDLLMQVEREGSSISYVDTFMIEGIKSDGDTVVIADQAFLVGGGSYSGASGSATLDESTIFNYDPMFLDAANGDFTLNAASAVLTAGHDGGAIGDRRWAFEIPLSIEENYFTPLNFELSQNYPNPFNPVTRINFTLPQRSKISIRIYDIMGRLVTTLLNEERPAGTHSIEWNAYGKATGLYFYQLTNGNTQLVKKMLLVK